MLDPAGHAWTSAAPQSGYSDSIDHADHRRGTGVPLFSTLATPQLELLAQTSADIHLGAGEYAVHEGTLDRALFAVLSGKIEVVRLFDGVERTLGWRDPRRHLRRDPDRHRHAVLRKLPGV